VLFIYILYSKQNNYSDSIDIQKINTYIAKTDNYFEGTFYEIYI